MTIIVTKTNSAPLKPGKIKILHDNKMANRRRESVGN